MLHIDGSHLEGGGQILRTSLALSCITGKPFIITDIRKNRPKPGLQPQHLHAVRAAQQLCGAKVSDASVGLESLCFEPGSIEAKEIVIDVGTAGSLTLLLQAVLLPAAFASKPVTFKLTGGTDVPFSQPYDYFANVLLKSLEPFADFKPALLRRGYYPRGGGKINLTVSPKYHVEDSFEDFFHSVRKNLPALNLPHQSRLESVHGISHASLSLKAKRVAERQLEEASRCLEGYAVDIRNEYSDALSPGSGITLWAQFAVGTIGADSLGRIGKRAEEVGSESARSLLHEIESQATVDRYLADQLLPWVAFLPSAQYRVSEITNHCLTNMFIVEKFLPVKFRNENGLITIS